MAEFPFPPSRNSPSYLWAHILLATCSLLLLAWRSRKPARLTDLAAWLTLSVVSIVLALSSSEISPLIKAISPTLFFLALLAAFVTGLRKLSQRRPRLAALIFSMVVFLGACLLMPVLNRHSSPPTITCKNNLKAIGVAVYNYESEFGQFPATFIRAASEPERSWRVNLLPYLDQQGLRDKYNDSDRWNGPLNSQLSRRCSYSYRCETHRFGKDSQPLKQDGTLWEVTDYAMVAGPHGFGSPSGRRASDFTDGMSNSIAFVEVSGRMIPWLKPEDVEPTPEALGVNLPGSSAGRSRGVLSSYHPDGAFALLADGSVRFINEGIAAKTLQAILTVDGSDDPGEF